MPLSAFPSLSTAEPGDEWSFTTATGGGCAPSVQQPTAYAIVKGSLKAGNLASLLNDDNDYLRVGSGAEPAVSIDYAVPAECIGQVTSLRVFIRSKDSKSSITRKLYLWNLSTSDWDLIAQNTVGTSESNIEATVTTGLNNYVDANGKVTVGIEQIRWLFSHDMYIEKGELGVNGG